MSWKLCSVLGIGCLLLGGCGRPNYLLVVQSGSRIQRHGCSDLAFRREWFGPAVWCIHRHQEPFEKYSMDSVLRVDTLDEQRPWIPNSVDAVVVK